MGDLIIYDLEKDMWVEKLKIKSAKCPPPMSHGAAYPVFYEFRQ